ncbi:hypothetical protein [Oceanobacillus luteolus]|uniref:hypothetical protein n=1 Tax=Oceanobacillus luteolus TaxID=1274358 RepID=UPI0036D35815
MACFCKARETQTLYTKCLMDEDLSEKEKQLLNKLIEHASHSSDLVKKYCELKAKE